MTTKIESIIIFILIVLLSFFITKWQRVKHESITKDTIINEKDDSIRYHRDRANKLVAEKSAAKIETREIPQAYPEVAEQLKELNIKLKELRSYTQSRFEAIGSGQALITNNYYDSTHRVKSRSLDFTDGYLSFHSDLFDSLDHAFSTYKYLDTLTSVISTRKKWLLGNEHLYATSKLQNPNAKILGTTNLLVENYRDKRFVVSVGLYYSPFAPKSYKVGPCVSLGWALFKF